MEPLPLLMCLMSLQYFQLCAKNEYGFLYKITLAPISVAFLSESISNKMTDAPVNMPKSTHVWAALGGVCGVGVSLFGMSLLLVHIQGKASKMGKLNGRIKRHLLLAKITPVSWTAYTLLQCAHKALNVPKYREELLKRAGFSSCGCNPSTWQAFLIESPIHAVTVLFIGIVCLLFSESGHYGACVGVTVGVVVRLWRIVSTLLEVPWDSPHEWKEVCRKGCFININITHLWRDLVVEQGDAATVLLSILLILNCRWSIGRIAYEVESLAVERVEKDEKVEKVEL